VQVDKEKVSVRNESKVPASLTLLGEDYHIAGGEMIEHVLETIRL
jgi:hypothetical protein